MDSTSRVAAQGIAARKFEVVTEAHQIKKERITLLLII